MRGRRRGAMLAATALSGCLRANPAYTSGDEGGSSGPGQTTGEATTGEVEPATSTGGTTTEIEQTTTGEGSGTTNGESTGAPIEGPAVIPAEVATCVLTQVASLGHVGPAQCEQRTSSALGIAGGGMIVDSSFHENGDGRPGIVYMRFAIPAQLPGGQLTAATLVFEVADAGGADSGAGGAVRLAQPFTAGDLETAAPGWLPGFEAFVGAVAPGQQVEIALPPEVIGAGAPLHVGIWPYSDDAAVYLSNAAAAERRPRLVLHFSE